MSGSHLILEACSKMICDSLLFILGMSIGSFLTVCAERLSEDSWPTGRSACDYCRKQLRVHDLIPVISWIVLRGRSSCCKKPLHIKYPLIELISGIVFVIVGRMSMNLSPLDTLSVLITTSTLLGIVIADVQYHIIPNVMTGILTVSALMQNGLEHVFASVGLLSGLYIVYILTKRRGIGLGDVKFMIPFGLMLGMHDGLIGLYIAVLTGGLSGLFLVLTGRRSLKSSIAFGPFLVIGLVSMLVWGDQIDHFVSLYILP